MIDMRDKPRHKHQIEWAVPHDLIGDMDVAAFGISGSGRHRETFPTCPAEMSLA